MHRQIGRLVCAMTVRNGIQIPLFNHVLVTKHGCLTNIQLPRYKGIRDHDSCTSCTLYVPRYLFKIVHDQHARTSESPSNQD